MPFYEVAKELRIATRLIKSLEHLLLKMVKAVDTKTPLERSNLNNANTNQFKLEDFKFYNKNLSLRQQEDKIYIKAFYNQVTKIWVNPTMEAVVKMDYSDKISPYTPKLNKLVQQDSRDFVKFEKLVFKINTLGSEITTLNIFFEKSIYNYKKYSMRCYHQEKYQAFIKNLDDQLMEAEQPSFF
jgi:hypothetical protein